MNSYNISGSENKSTKEVLEENLKIQSTLRFDRELKLDKSKLAYCQENNKNIEIVDTLQNKRFLVNLVHILQKKSHFSKIETN